MSPPSPAPAGTRLSVAARRLYELTVGDAIAVSPCACARTPPANAEASSLSPPPSRGEDVVAALPERDVHVVARALVLAEGLRHERREQAVARRDVLHDLLEQEGAVGGRERVGVREVDLELPGRELAVRGRDADVEAVERGVDLPQDAVRVGADARRVGHAGARRVERGPAVRRPRARGRTRARRRPPRSARAPRAPRPGARGRRGSRAGSARPARAGRRASRRCPAATASCAAWSGRARRARRGSPGRRGTRGPSAARRRGPRRGSPRSRRARPSTSARLSIGSSLERARPYGSGCITRTKRMPSVRSRAAAVSTSSPVCVPPTAPPRSSYSDRAVRYGIRLRSSSGAATASRRSRVRRVRVLHQGEPAVGVLAAGEVVLDDGGARLDAETVTWLAPVDAEQDHRGAPHLPLAARRVRGARAGRAVVLPQAADDAERPSRRRPPPARRALPQLRGRARGRRRPADAGRRRGRRARARVRLRAGQRRRPARLPPRRPRLDAARQGPGRLPADRPRRRDARRVVARRRLRAAHVPERRGRAARPTRTTSSGTTATSSPISAA